MHVQSILTRTNWKLLKDCFSNMKLNRAADFKVLQNKLKVSCYRCWYRMRNSSKTIDACKSLLLVCFAQINCFRKHNSRIWRLLWLKDYYDLCIVDLFLSLISKLFLQSDSIEILMSIINLASNDFYYLSKCMLFWWIYIYFR